MGIYQSTIVCPFGAMNILGEKMVKTGFHIQDLTLNFQERIDYVGLVIPPFFVRN
jgi:hypothetical protein